MTGFFIATLAAAFKVEVTATEEETDLSDLIPRESQEIRGCRGRTLTVAEEWLDKDH